MKVKHKKPLEKYFIRNLKNLLLSKVTFVLFFCLFFVFLLFLSYKDRVVNNTFLGRSNLGWQRGTQAREVLKRVLEDYASKPATFVYKDKIVEAKYTELGIDFDVNATLDQLFFFGQARNPVEDLFNLLTSFFRTTIINPVYSFNASMFEDFINREFSSLEKKRENAKFIDNNGKILVSNSKSGEVVDRSSAAWELAISLDRLSEMPIELKSAQTTPNVETADLNELLDKYNSLLEKKIILSWEYDTWKLQGDDLISILRVGDKNYTDDYFYEFKAADAPVRLTYIKVVGEFNNPVEIFADNNAIGNFLEKISNVVDRPTVNATAKFDGRKVTDFTPALDGRQLDIEKTKEQIISFVNTEKDTEDQLITIKLPIMTTIASVANDQINSLGIKELIGKGVSYFSGSIVNRIYNIELGARKINGTLIAPGEVFSFNNTVGEVSGRTGYRQAYVISSGRTVLDDGGGICQVSTTIFRAALNSGLQIISRTAHAYRVGYYEQGGFGPGLDATVFAPSVDFKFKNDTGRHILIQTVFNRARAMLEVDIYGTRDGRTVEQGKSVILSKTPAPAEIRQDDPSLPKGMLKQVDFAAEGADVYFKRKVFKDEQILHDDKFSSKFRPWQAVFLVGTGT